MSASASVFDWIGATRDFSLAPVHLSSFVYPLNCSESFAFLLAGTDVLEQLQWNQTDNYTCGLDFAPAPGDYTLVSALRGLDPPATRLVVFRKDALGTPNAAASIEETDSNYMINLTLNGALDDCALPTTFDYCGAEFTESACGSYTGSCVANSTVPPLGCRGDSLFAPFPVVTPTPHNWAVTPAGIAVITTTATVAVVVSVVTAVIPAVTSTAPALAAPVVVVAGLRKYQSRRRRQR